MAELDGTLQVVDVVPAGCSTPNCQGGSSMEIRGKASFTTASGTPTPESLTIIAQLQVADNAGGDYRSLTGIQTASNQNQRSISITVRKCRALGANKFYRLAVRVVGKMPNDVRYAFPGRECKCSGISNCKDKEGEGDFGGYVAMSKSTKLGQLCNPLNPDTVNDRNIECGFLA